MFPPRNGTTTFSDKELKTFVPVIKSTDKASEKTYCFFNNCHAGSAAKNARRIKSLLGLVDQIKGPRPEEKREGPEQLGLFS